MAVVPRFIVGFGLGVGLEFSGLLGNDRLMTRVVVAVDCRRSLFSVTRRDRLRDKQLGNSGVFM